MYRRSPQGWLKHIDFIILDIVCLQVAFLLAYVTRLGFQNPYADSSYCSIAMVYMLVDVAVIIYNGTMSNVLRRGYYKELVATIKHVCIVEMVVAFYLFSIKGSMQYSRIIIYMLAVYYVLIAYLVRLSWKYMLKKRVSAYGSRSMFLVTTKDRAEELIQNIVKENHGAVQVTGMAVIDNKMVGRIISGLEVKTDLAHLSEYLCREWVDEVFISLPESEPYPKELINQLTIMGIAVHIELQKTASLIGQKQFIEKIGTYTVLTTSINTATLRQAAIKRAMDIAGGLVGCLITVILTVILGPIIYIKSPGPIFFSQVRIGKNGKKFKMYKFRSMYMDAEERKKELMEKNRVKDGMMFKLDWDPRIIGSKELPDGTVKKGIGNYIRDWSLDEFPQFFNVLKGDMSLVGTRPPTVDEWEKYELHHRARLAMKPGITGMWQVSGRSNITDFEEVVKLDKKYITEWSMGLDFQILIRTVGAVFGKDGAM